MVKKTKIEQHTTGTASDGASFVLGIFSIFLAGWFGLISGVIGLILTLKQRRKIKTRLSATALILNIIGLILSIAVIIIFTVFAEEIAQYFQQYSGLQ